MRVRFGWVAGLAAAAITSASFAVAEPPSCGAPGRPPCPLQAWMRAEIARPLASRELSTLASALERLAKMNPDPGKWRNWDAFALDGAKRAREGKAPVSACVNCHRIYRAEYNARFRRRAVAP